MSKSTENKPLSLDEPMDFETLVKNKDALVKLARETRMKYEIPLKIRDQEHYVAVVKSIAETVSKNINEWGFTSMVITDLKDTKDAVTTSVLVYKEMPEVFDEKAYGMYLSMM